MGVWILRNCVGHHLLKSHMDISVVEPYGYLCCIFWMVHFQCIEAETGMFCMLGSL